MGYEVRIFKEKGVAGHTKLTRNTIKEVEELFKEVPVKDFYIMVVKNSDKQVKKK